MTWIFAVAAMVSYAIADFASKQSAGRVTPSVATFFTAITALILPALWVAADQGRGSWPFSTAGLFWAGVTGIALSAAAGFLFLLFNNGLSLSTASPVVRAGGLVIAGALGVLLLHEQSDIRFVAGLTLTTVGIALIAFR